MDYTKDKRRRTGLYVKPRRKRKVAFSYYVSSRLDMLLWKFAKSFLLKI